MVIKAETHNLKIWRKRWLWSHLALNEMSLSKPSSLGLGVFERSELDRLWEGQVVDNSKEISCRHSGMRLTQTVTSCRKLMQVQTGKTSQHRAEETDIKCHSQPRSNLHLIPAGKGKNHFFPQWSEYPWVSVNHTAGQIPCPQATSWPTQKRLHVWFMLFASGLYSYFFVLFIFAHFDLCF